MFNVNVNGFRGANVHKKVARVGATFHRSSQTGLLGQTKALGVGNIVGKRRGVAISRAL